MASKTLLTCFVLLAVAVVVAVADDLQVGTSVNGQLAYAETVELSSIPLKTRTKNVFYNDEGNKTIKGISALDKDKKGAHATITSGGVGFSYANLRLKSERGEGLNYEVQFFV